jgi:hypothetical protein
LGYYLDYRDKNQSLVNEKLLVAAFSLRNDRSKRDTRDSRLTAVRAIPVDNEGDETERGKGLEKGTLQASMNLKPPSVVNMQQLEDSLPPVFHSSTSMTEKVTDELKRYHKYVGAVMYYSETFPRAYRVLDIYI